VAAIVFVSNELVDGMVSGAAFASMTDFGSARVFLIAFAALTTGLAAGAARRDADSSVAGAILAAVVPWTILSAFLPNDLDNLPGHSWSYDAMALNLIYTSHRFGTLGVCSASVLGAMLPLWRELPPGRDRRLVLAFVSLVASTLVLCELGVGFRFSGRFVEESIVGRFVALRLCAAIGLLLGLVVAAALHIRVVWLARGEVRVAMACGVAGVMLLLAPIALVVQGRATRDLHRVASLLVERRFEAIEVDGRTVDPDYAPDVVLTGNEQFVVLDRQAEYAYHEMNGAYEAYPPTRPRRATGADLDRSLATIASEQWRMRDEVRSGRFVGGEEYQADERLRAPDSVVLTVMIDRHERAPALARVVSSAIGARFERIDFVVMRATRSSWRTPAFLRSVFPGLEFARSDFRTVTAYTSDRSEGAVGPVTETLRVGSETDPANLIRRIASLREGVRPVLVVAGP